MFFQETTELKKINNEVFGIILSGGKSRRMGSDKSLKKIKNKNMIEFVVDRLLRCFMFVCSFLKQI